MDYYTNSKTNTDWLFKYIDFTKPELIIRKCNLKSESAVDCSSLKDVRQVGSYNWSFKSSRHDPIIIIPGIPNHFKRNARVNQLKKIKHVQIMDMNSHFLPEFPLEPVLRSVIECSPEFQFKNIDFVSDRGGIKKLFNFIDNCDINSFRIDFKRIGNQILFIRNDETIMNFAEDYTKDFAGKFSIKSESSYRKVVSYKFGNLNLLIHFEVDCVDIDEESLLFENQNVDEININLNPVKFTDSKLSFINKGIFKSNEKLLQITTQADHRPSDLYLKTKWVQGFFSQIDYLFIGIHSYGKIQKIDKLSFKEVSEKCNKSKEAIQSPMNKLHDLLNMLKDLTMDSANSPYMMSIIFEKEYDPNVLRVFKNKNILVVPNTLYRNLGLEVPLNTRF